MKAAISCNYDPMYLFCLPIVTWAWNKMGCGVLVTMPTLKYCDNAKLWGVVLEQMMEVTEAADVSNSLSLFHPPDKNREVTYTQCSRLYATADYTQMSETEIIVTSDVDMAVFVMPPPPPSAEDFCVWGHDLVPPKQYPICYISGYKKAWDKFFNMGRNLQTCLDQLLGEVNCDNMRGNYWAKDQEEAYRVINLFAGFDLIKRAKVGTQFAANRIDRDDAYWEERLFVDIPIIDAHLWRPAYREDNVKKIVRLFRNIYQQDDFTWIFAYAKKFNDCL